MNYANMAYEFKFTDAFFENLKAEGDRRHVCGLPPIYLALRLLGEVSGEPAGYAQCPADPQGW